MDRSNSYIPLAICDSKLRALYAGEKPSASLCAHAQCSHARRSARTHATQRARRSARAHSRRSARTRAAQRDAAAVRICRSVPRGPCMRRKLVPRGRGRNPNSPVPPLPPTPLPPPSSGRVGWRKEMQFPAGSSIDASCDRSLRPMDWLTHVGPRLSARRAAASGPAGPKQLPAQPARCGCSNLENGSENA